MMLLSKRACFGLLLTLTLVSVFFQFPYYTHLIHNEFETLMKGVDYSAVEVNDKIKSSSVRLIPLCTEGILDKRIVNQNPASSEEIHLPLSSTSDNSCRLHHYSRSDVVQCVDGLRTSENMTGNRTTINNRSNNKIHVAFIGDSRIRHMYHALFLSLFPLIENSCPESAISTGDICVEDPLLDVYFTYTWRKKFNENYTLAIKNWIEGEKPPPNYLVMGSTAHHIQEKKNGVLDYNKFEESITQLSKLLHELSKRYGTRIVWWSDDVAPNTFDSEQSFIQLNDVIRRVFKKNKTPVQLWDSSNDLFMAYIKTCEAQLGRKVPWVTSHFPQHPNSWLNCDDIIHAPQAYTLVQIQTIVNDLCNRVLQ